MLISFTFFIATLFVASFLYFRRKHKYWSNRGIDGPQGLPLLGNFYDVADVNKPRCFVLNEWTKLYGETFGYYEGTVPVLVTSNLELLNEVFIKQFDHFYARKLTNMLHGDMESLQEEPRVNLFTARGPRWQKLRALTTPGFSVASLKRLHGKIEESVFRMVELLGEHENGGAFNIHIFFQEFTYDVISRLAMGQQRVKQFENAGIDVVKKILLKTHRVLPWYLASIFPQFEFKVKKLFYNHENVRGGKIAELFMYCAKSVMERMKQRVSVCENFALFNILLQGEKAAQGQEIEQNDFIDLFLDHHSEIEQSYNESRKTIKQASAEDVIGSCFVLLLAGFDTTANALGCAAHLLALNPEKMKIAQEEIDEVCSSDNITYEQIGQLQYLDAVIKESLRLSPVAWFACSRECVKQTTLGPHLIDEGVRIEADVKAIHYSKEIWGDDAELFVPERWFAEQHHPLSSLAFGAGKRKCVGMRLGMSEAKMALAHVLRKWSIAAGPGTEEKLHFQGCTTTSPEKVTVHLKARS
ncbi:hypothetical protein B9Z55_028033 [Caenorhabditis nigoni]|uniref:Cytochrome P450 n=1 Tax=Caenorhabditis nigoni TaxID=1611254 RepID=A0A2G5SDC5_9PELO|nr:hypothetical protein B9Z55_028033 [Caenorhabditis nigoni]